MIKKSRKILFPDIDRQQMREEIDQLSTIQTVMLLVAILYLLLNVSGSGGIFELAVIVPLYLIASYQKRLVISRVKRAEAVH